MRGPLHTLQHLEALNRLHDRYSRDARALLRSYAADNKEHKQARDVTEAAEEVVFIFVRAVQRQLR